MIVGINNLDSLDVIMKLHEMKHEFSLTGSRFFSPCEDHSKSDWDFFASYSEDVEKELTDLSFHELSPRDYLGRVRNHVLNIDVVKIMRNHTIIPHIDVILSSHYKERKAVQKVMKQFSFESKDSRAWNKLFLLALRSKIEAGEIEV